MATHPQQAGASAPSAVVPIRRNVRIKWREIPDQLPLAARSKWMRSLWEKLAAEQDEKERHALACLIVVAERDVPRFHLRCIHGTLDEQRDFDLRCSEVEIIKAEHELMSARLDRLRVLEGWESKSEEHEDLWNKAQRQWHLYRDRLHELARTPARTIVQLDRKKRIIGKFWLTCEGEWYDDLRAGVAADEAWLAENAPKRRRRA